MRGNARDTLPDSINGRLTRQIRRYLGNIFVLSGGMLLSILLLELGSRFYLTHLASREQFVRYASPAQIQAVQGGEFFIEPHYYLGYSGTPDYSEEGVKRHNSQGYRGNEIVVPKPPGEFRIACVGSSTTYDDCIEDYRFTYPSVLEKELRDRGYNVTVINAGMSGWSSYEDLINYALRLCYLQPDLIVLYEAFNDLCLRIVWPVEAYRGDNSGAFEQKPISPSFSLVEWSTALRMVLIRAGYIEPFGTVANAVGQYAGTLHANDFLEQATGGAYPQGIFQNAPLSEILASNKPHYYERNICHLISMARQDKVQMLMVTFAWSPDAFTGWGEGGQAFLAGLEEMNATMRSLASQTDTPLLDLSGVFPADAAYWSDIIHNNEAGAAVKARMIAEKLLNDKMIPDEFAVQPK